MTEQETTPVAMEDDEDDFLITKSKKKPQKRLIMDVDSEKSSDKKPNFAEITEGAEKAAEKAQNVGVKWELRKIHVPRHRYAPLKAQWLKLVKPIVEQLKLQIRFNLKARSIELRATPEAKEAGALQKANDFLHAFVVGFSVEDALALIRLDDLYVESFEVEDVKPLKGEHLVRAIGRVAGHNGKTKYTIENATRTRIVLAEK